MTKFAEINEPRIAKIMAILDTMDTSAKSNKADAELFALLNPIRTRLGAIVPTMSDDDDGGDESPNTAQQPISRERLDYSIACSKADRAVRACEKVLAELTELKNAIPS